MPKSQSELPGELGRYLVEPFLVHLRRGVIEELFVNQDEPIVITNIKKALLSQLQLDLTASRIQDVKSSKGEETSSESNQSSGVVNYFQTFESSILGDCETSYTVNPIPKYQAHEIEDRIKTQEKELKSRGVWTSGVHTSGEQACQGKQYWEVIKTTNFDNCKEMPVYQSAAGINIKCDFSKSQCNDAATVSNFYNIQNFEIVAYKEGFQNCNN